MALAARRTASRMREEYVPRHLLDGGKRIAVLDENGYVKETVDSETGKVTPVPSPSPPSAYKKEGRQSETREDERQEVLRMIQTLQQQLESLTAADNPNSQETASRILVLYRKLTRIGLCPAKKNSNPNDIDQWSMYLNFILPYVEEFGIGPAREETRKWNDETNE